jgi:hypothetical protein
MMFAARSLGALLGAVVLVGAGVAQAEDLILDCRVHANQPDHGKTDWRRRLVFPSSTHMVEIYDDFGDGLKRRDSYRVEKIKPHRITLENRDGKLAYVDGETHTYQLRDAPRGFTLEGPCVRAVGGR